jgi:hypothetical protein
LVREQADVRERLPPGELFDLRGPRTIADEEEENIRARALREPL